VFVYAERVYGITNLTIALAWALEGGVPPWNLKISAKKIVSLVSSGKKQISTLLPLPANIFEIIPSGPPGKKSFRRP